MHTCATRSNKLDMPDQFLRIPELCELLRIKRHTLYRMIKEGELNPIKIRNTTVFSRQQIIQYMKDKVEGK